MSEIADAVSVFAFSFPSPFASQPFPLQLVYASVPTERLLR